jgi:putative membrane protein
MEPSTTDYSWNIPQRQSPAAISIMLLKTALRLVKTLWPLILIYFLRKQKSQGDIGILWMIVGFGALGFITTLIRYWFYQFHIDKGSLIIQSGWLKKKTLTLPLKSIMAVHLQQNVWQQFLKVAKVTLDSSGSEKVEVKIDALSIAKAEELKHILLSQKEMFADTTDLPAAPPQVRRLSFTDLIKLSLSANHLEAFFILFALGMNILQDIRKIFNVDGWAFVGNYAGKVHEQKVLAISVLIIVIALLSVVVSVIRTSLKYYDFRMEDAGQGWKISFGLITRQQLLVPFNKIQVLSWHANWLRRKLDFWIVQVQSIGHDEVKHKQHIHIPLTQLEQVLTLTHGYQRSPVFDPAQGSMIAPARWKRKTIVFAIPATIIPVIVFYLVTGYPALWLVLLFPAIARYHYTWYRNFRWAVNDEGIQSYSGVWGRRYTLLTWKKVQQVELKQSIYQRARGLATLKFITAGGNVFLYYIRYETAKQLADQVLYFVESGEEKWM